MFLIELNSHANFITSSDRFLFGNTIFYIQLLDYCYRNLNKYLSSLDNRHKKPVTSRK